MGDAGTPRGLSKTEDGGPSTQRGEPLGEDGDSLLAGGFGHAWPQAPDVVMRIGSEAGSAAAFTATAAPIKSSSLPGEAGGRDHSPDEARSRAPRTAFLHRQVSQIVGSCDADGQATLGSGGFPARRARRLSSGFTTNSATSLMVNPARTPFCNSFVAAMSNRNDFGRNPRASRSAVASFSASNANIEALT